MVMRIQELRKACGMKQVELAKKVGVTQGTASGWEIESYLPNARQLPQLAQALGVTIDELFEPIEGAS